MAKFGLITEGITDQIVIENILCGFYKNYEDLDEEIIPLEPPRDETDKQQAYSDFGTGWSAIFSYLSEKRFRDDVLNSEYIIIQIDTDIADDIKCDKTQSVDDIISCLRAKIIDEIDKNDSFYKENRDKIIFAISIHSLECWILPIYSQKNEVIHKCFDKLKIEVPKVSKKLKVNKTYSDYDKLSRIFVKHKELMKLKSKNKSFEIFIDNLPKEI